MKTIIKSFVLPLCIMVGFLSCAEGDKFDPNKAYLAVTGTEVYPVVMFPMDDTPATYLLSSSATHRVDEEMIIKYEVDEAALETYNEKNKTTYFPVPTSSFRLSAQEDTIKVGRAASTGIQVQIISTDEWIDGRVYVIPVSIKEVVGEGVELLKTSKTIFLRISRTMSFQSLDISPTSSAVTGNLYSEFHFVKSTPGFEPISLPRFTCEIKVLLTEDNPNRIRRLFNWGGGGDPQGRGQGQNMLRFGEEGGPGGDKYRNSLQWVNPSGGVFSRTLFEPNRWYTISLTYDGSTYVMYVDGVRDAEGEGSSPFTFSHVEIGMSWAGYTNGQRTLGRIAEARLWDRALSSGEMQLGICGVDPNSEGLIGYWKFNEGTGHVFHDATSNGYHLDWSDTYREPSENGVVAATNKSTQVAWIMDAYNRCNQ